MINYSTIREQVTIPIYLWHIFCQHPVRKLLHMIFGNKKNNLLIDGLACKSFLSLVQMIWLAPHFDSLMIAAYLILLLLEQYVTIMAFKKSVHH